MTPEATLARFREYMVGPTRFMNLLSCFELGIIDALRENPGMAAAELAEVVGVRPDAVAQLLNLLVKENFVAYVEDSGGYSLAALAEVPPADLQRALGYMNLIDRERADRHGRGPARTLRTSRQPVHRGGRAQGSACGLGTTDGQGDRPG